MSVSAEFWIKAFEGLENHKKRTEAEAEFDKLHGPRRFQTVELPKSEWKICSLCNGTGLRFEPGDLHRSEGFVPCDKMITTKTVEIKRRVRVKAGRRVVG